MPDKKPPSKTEDWFAANAPTADWFASADAKEETPSSRPGPGPGQSYLGQFGQKVVTSGVKAIKDLASGLNPLNFPEAGKGLLRLAKGTAEVMTGMPMGESDADVARGVGQIYKDRYGGLENIANTLYNDPVGAAVDVSTLLAGAGAGLRAASLGRTASTVGKLGSNLLRASDMTNPLKLVTAPIDAGLKAAGTGLAHMTVRPGTALERQAGAGDKFRIAREVASKGLWNPNRASANFGRAIEESKDLVRSSNLPPVDKTQIVDFPQTLDRIVQQPGKQMAGLEEVGKLEQALNRDLPGQVPITDLFDYMKSWNRSSNDVFRAREAPMPGGPTRLTGQAYAEAVQNANKALAGVEGLKDAQRAVQTAMLTKGAVENAAIRPHALTRLLAIGAGGTMRNLPVAAGMMALDSPMLGAVGGKGLWELGSAANNPAALRAALLARMGMPPE